MGALSRQVKKALGVLQMAYKNGVIPYPRVDNTFISNQSYDLFPHPPMGQLSPLMAPISDPIILVNKKSALLVMSASRTLQPSTIFDSAEMLDEYFNDDLSFVSPAKEKKINQILKVYSDYAEKEGLGEGMVIRLMSDFCSEVADSSGSGFSLFKANDLRFQKNETEPLMAQAPSMLQSFTRWSVSPRKKTGMADKKQPDAVVEVMEVIKANDGLSRFKNTYLDKKKAEEHRRRFAEYASEVVMYSNNIISACNDAEANSINK